MSYFKKTVAVLLVAVMALGIVACGKKEENPNNEVTKSKLYQEETRAIYIGTWYESYYTSAHDDINDNPNVDNIAEAEMNLNNMRTIEQKYNIELYYDNLTWNGVIESINTSIMAGSPESDVYMVDMQFGLPAVLAGYAYDLEYILNESPEAQNGMIEDKYKDILTDAGSNIVKTIQFTTDGKHYLFGANAIDLGGMALGYNMDLISQYGLTDPYEYFLNGQWNWDNWLAEMQTLTQDTNSDGAMSPDDMWGYRGAWTNLLIQLLMSNNATIASLKDDGSGKITEQLTSKPATEVLNFLYDMYQTYGVSFWDADCDADWNDNVYAFASGNIGFWNSACWITQEADPDQNLINSMGMVTWPTGPSGNAETNPNINSTTGTYYMIPAGIENPALIFCVLYDYFNWYNDDLSIRDNTTWFEEWCYNEQNFEVLKSMGDSESDYVFDLWQQITFAEEYQIRGIIETGADATPITVAEFQQANKQLVQDYLDQNFNKSN